MAATRGERARVEVDLRGPRPGESGEAAAAAPAAALASVGTGGASEDATADAVLDAWAARALLGGGEARSRTGVDCRDDRRTAGGTGDLLARVVERAMAQDVGLCPVRASEVRVCALCSQQTPRDERRLITQLAGTRLHDLALALSAICGRIIEATATPMLCYRSSDPA